MILLDTHALVWVATTPEALSRRARAAIERASRGEGIAIASVTLFELADHAWRGRLHTHLALRHWLEELIRATRVTVFEVTPEIAATAASLPRSGFPGDPMDRIIAATALVHDMALVTKDRRLLGSPVIRTIW